MSLQFVDLFETTLSANYTAGGTSLTLASVSGLPASGDHWIAVFDPANTTGTYELFKVTGAPTGSTVPVAGGRCGTTNRNHASGESVYGGVWNSESAAQFAADIAGGSITVNAQTGTTYTLLASDAGKLVTFNNASEIIVTVPSGLGSGFYCRMEQLGAGQVVLSGSGATVSNRQSFTSAAGQYAIVELIAQASNSLTLFGDAAARILRVTTTTLPDGQVGVAYSQALAAVGGFTPYTWSVSSGSLPASLSLSSGGTISGTPSASGTSSFTAQVTDAHSVTATQALSLLIAAAAFTTSYANPASTGDRRALILVRMTAFGGGATINMVDGSTSNACFFTGTTSAETVTFYFDHPYWIEEVRWKQGDSATHGTWIIEGTADDSTWTSVYSSFTLGGSTTQTIATLSTPSPWVALRLVGQSGSLGLSTWLLETEFKISTAINPNSTSYSNTGGMGARTGVITATASSGTINGGGSSPTKLVDGSHSQAGFLNNAAASGQWMQFDFGSGKIITQARFYMDTAANMGVWKWQGSNDASSWTDIGSSFTFGASAWDNGSSERVQVMQELRSNSASYRYYRMLGVSGTAANTVWLYEIDFCIS